MMAYSISIILLFGGILSVASCLGYVLARLSHSKREMEKLKENRYHKEEL